MAPLLASLDALPEELVLAILSHVHTLSALAQLSLTNYRLRRLSLPYLYNAVPGRNSELFLRTISHHPDLALYVKKAIWQQERRTVPHISPLEKQHIINRLNELCVPHGTDLAAQFAKFGKNDDYWYFEILLLFCPNLLVIQVKESWFWDDHHYWFKSLSPFFNPLCVSTLHRALIEGPMRIENIVPLLTIPTLRELELTQVTVMRREGYRVFQWSVWPVTRILPERGSGLEILALRQSYIDLDLLVPVLQGIKGLMSFTYEHMPNDLADEAVQAHCVNARALASCLGTHADSLQHIRVRDTEVVDWTCMPAYLFGPANIATNAHNTFPNLKTIDIGPTGEGTLSPYFVSSSSEPEDWVPQVFPASVTTLRIQPASHIESKPGSATARTTQGLKCESEVDLFLQTQACNFARADQRVKVELVEWNPTLGWFPDNLAALQRYFVGMSCQLESIPGDVSDFYDAEPLIIDDGGEEGWVVVTDLHLAIK